MKMFSKIFGSSVAVAVALVTGAATSQAAPAIVNPGFESATGFTANPIGLSGENQGWATFGSSRSDMSASVDFPQSGTNSLLAVNGVGNNWNPQGAYQIVSGVTPGQTYTFSSYFLTDTGTTYGTPVALQLGFGNFSGTSFVDLGSIEAGAGNNVTWGFNGPAAHPDGSGAIPSLDTWYQGSVSATAPAGATDAVMYLFFMDNGQTTTENVYFDTTTLTSAPEPSTLALLGMGLAAPFFLRRRKA
jgi:hypothetical protein